jgi:hypothetical protein
MVNGMTAVDSFLVQKDARGRVSLGSVMTDDRYLVSVDAEGRIILEPAVVMTVSEQRLLTDAAFLRRMSAAAQSPATRIELDDI